MSTRIRYHKDSKNNRLVSSVLTSKLGARYVVRLYPDEMRFEIVNLGNGNNVKKGQSRAKDIRYLKEMVRRHIKKSNLLLNLKTEIRRKNG